jgi:tetratricopeptide (TPR) repeat protein
MSLRPIRLKIGDYYYNQGNLDLAAYCYGKVVRKEKLRIDQGHADSSKYEQDFSRLKCSLKNLLHKGFAHNSIDQHYFSILSLAASSNDHFEEIRVYWALLNNSLEALLNIGDQLLNLGQSDRALTYYRVIVSRFPHSSEGHLKLAEALYRQRRLTLFSKRYFRR